jgi:hypothetical protein
MMPFLAIDDMKVEYLKDTRTSTRLEIFEQVIKYRVDALMPTMITTNNTPDEIPDRMRSRLSDARYARLIANKHRITEKEMKQLAKMITEELKYLEVADADFF